jgi:hypothetical protein
MGSANTIGGGSDVSTEQRSASATLVQAAQAVIESWARGDRPDVLRVHIGRLEGAVLDEPVRVGASAIHKTNRNNEGESK